MVVRNLVAQDLPEVANLFTLFWGDSQNIKKMSGVLEQMEQDAKYIQLVAEEKGEVIGVIFGILCLDLYGDCKPYAILENFIIHPDFRRNEVGEALFLELEQRLMKLGCAQIQLVTEHSREDACRFYLKMGFKATDAGFKKKI